MAFTTSKEMIKGLVESLRKAGYEKEMRYPVPTSITEPLIIPEAWTILNSKLKR